MGINIYDYHNDSEALSAAVELIAELEAKLNAVEHKLGEYMATDDPVAISYAVQLRRVIHTALKEDE